MHMERNVCSSINAQTHIFAHAMLQQKDDGTTSQTMQHKNATDLTKSF